MRQASKAVISLALLLSVPAFADNGPHMKCRVNVPKEYKRAGTIAGPPPNGEPESVRYTVAYEAFWWNCVAVRAVDIDGRCPFGASGTPGAAAGAADGEMNADAQIDALLKKYSAQVVGTYLRSIAAQATAKEKMRPYFDRPRPEHVN